MSRDAPVVITAPIDVRCDRFAQPDDVGTRIFLEAPKCEPSGHNRLHLVGDTLRPPTHGIVDLCGSLGQDICPAPIGNDSAINRTVAMDGADLTHDFNDVV